MADGAKVADAFADRSVLVTGASGFLGKVLVEKLLYTMPAVKCVYLLIRPLNGLTPRERLDKLLESPLFERLRLGNPSALSKLVAVSGDLTEEDLGLNPLDMHSICDDVAIVFHCAATVKFDEALRTSVAMNVVGTQRLIALCHKMRNLVAIVHASTAYANCDKATTVEEIYPPPVPLNKLFDAIEWMDDNMIQAVTPHLLGQRPNTYTFTKALAEVQLVEDAKHLPLIIVRPSIIGAMWKDPLPGWTDNINGPTGIFATCGKGVLSNMCGSTASKADIIPVDIVSNLMIVAAAHRASARLTIHIDWMTCVCPGSTLQSRHSLRVTSITTVQRNGSTSQVDSSGYERIPVVHCCTGTLNPIKWERIVSMIECFYRAYPLNECYRVPSAHFHSSRTLFALNFYVKHLAPAYVLDFFNRVTGRKQMYVRMYGKVWRVVESLHYFTTRGWNFQSDGLVSMWNSLSETDKQTFNFDVRQLDWDSYLFDYMMGVKRYIMKDSLDEIPKARRNLLWLKLYSTMISAGIVWMLVRIFARRRFRRRQQFTAWALGLLFVFVWSNFSFRPAVRLKSLEEYKRSSYAY